MAPEQPPSILRSEAASGMPLSMLDMVLIIFGVLSLCSVALLIRRSTRTHG